MAWLLIPGNIRCAFKGSDQPYHPSAPGYFLPTGKSVQSKQEENTQEEQRCPRKKIPYLNSVISGNSVLSFSLGCIPAWIQRSPAAQHHLHPFHIQKVLDQLFCFPNFINYLCFSSSTEEFPWYYHSRHLSSKCRDSSYFKLFVLKIMLSSFLISSDYFKSLSQWIK